MVKNFKYQQNDWENFFIKVNEKLNNNYFKVNGFSSIIQPYGGCFLPNEILKHISQYFGSNSNSLNELHSFLFSNRISTHNMQRSVKKRINDLFGVTNTIKVFFTSKTKKNLNEAHNEKIVNKVIQELVFKKVPTLDEIIKLSVKFPNVVKISLRCDLHDYSDGYKRDKKIKIKEFLEKIKKFKCLAILDLSANKFYFNDIMKVFKSVLLKDVRIEF